MKSIVHALIIVAALASSAQADIFCQSSAANKLNVIIEEGTPSQNSIFSQSYPVLVTVTGLRLYYKTKAAMVSLPHQTRLDVGIKYQIDLGKGFSIHLKNSTYAPVGYEHLLGFTGTYGNGQANNYTKLSCKNI